MAAEPDFIRINNTLMMVSNKHIEDLNGHFEVPNSVTVLIYNTFAKCTSLKRVTMHDLITNIDDIIFNDELEDLEITIKASEPSTKKAQELGKKLQAKYPYIKIHIDKPLERFKGIPTFFPQKDNAQSSPNNQSGAKP